MGDPVKNIELDDLLAAEPVGDETTKPIKKVEYTVDDLLNAEPLVRIPDYDKQLESKFIENKAVQSGLLDSVKPFSPQLYEAKKDQITPFIQEVEGTNGKQPQFDINAFEAKIALDKNIKRQQEINANAVKLNLPPELLNQAVELNDSFIPVEEDKKIQESYLFGTLASFNDGLSTVFDAVDNAATFLAESTGFKWKNNFFKDVSKSLKSVGKEGGYATPETIVGDVTSAMASFAPDLALTFAAPEMKLPQLARLTGGLVRVIPKFPAWLGAKTGLQMWSQTKKPGDLAYGVAKGFTEGVTFEYLGVLGNQAGLLAKALGAGQLATTATAGIASGTLFGGHSVISDPEIWENGKIDWEKAKNSFWTNFGVGLAFHGKKIGEEVINTRKIEASATRKAYVSYMTSSRDMIKTGLESKKTQYELRRESQKYWENALRADNPGERSQNLLAKTAIDNIILARPIAEMVALKPQKFKEIINSDKTMNDAEKKYFLQKIDNTVEDYQTFEKTGTEEGKFDKDYFIAGRMSSRNDIIKKLDKVESEEELVTMKFPAEDVELKTLVANRKKELRLQEKETVKQEPEKIITEKKTEISELQQPETKEVPKSEQKVATVKEEKEKKFTEFTKSLGITKPETALEGAKRGNIGKTSVILSEGKEAGEVVLETIKTPKAERGKGEANKALDKVIEEADKQDVTLKLTAVPQEGSKMGKQQLIDWYKKKGFQFEEGSDVGIRKPVKPAEEIKAEIPEVVKEKINKAAEISNKIENTDGASKKQKLEKEKEEILDTDPKLKYLDENMGRIREALEKMELLKMKGPCPV